jgi:hypothetical protein
MPQVKKHTAIEGSKLMDLLEKELSFTHVSTHHNHTKLIIVGKQGHVSVLNHLVPVGTLKGILHDVTDAGAAE